jgi:hypothetical protein
MRLVLSGGILVTASAPLTPHPVRGRLDVGHRPLAGVTVETIETLVHRVLEIVSDHRVVVALFVAIETVRTVDWLVLVLGLTDNGGRPKQDDGGR